MATLRLWAFERLAATVTTSSVSELSKPALCLNTWDKREVEMFWKNVDGGGRRINVSKTKKYNEFRQQRMKRCTTKSGAKMYHIVVLVCNVF